MDRSAIAVILANAIVWAGVMLGAALGGTDCYSQVSTVLYGGAGASVVVVGGGAQQLVTG